MSRHKNLLDAQKACLVVIDVQERFAPHIHEFAPMVKNICVLARAARILNLPVLITEQYVKGLGPTVSEIKEATGDVPTFEKNCFAITGQDQFNSCLKGLARPQVIVCGIETHVCVNQSVHGLLQDGYQVHVVEDAVGSRNPLNKTSGLNKMQASNANLTVVEMALFEMLKEAGTDQFKAVQALVK